MNANELAEKWQGIKKLSDDEIHEKLAQKIWRADTVVMAERELHNREQKRVLESLVISAAASDKAARAADKTASATYKLVKATWVLVFLTFIVSLISAYTGIYLPRSEKKDSADFYIKSLKHSLPLVFAHTQQNIKMIDANRKILSKNIPVLNSLFHLEKPIMGEVVHHIKDMNVRFSIGIVKNCIDILNQNITERNQIYTNLIQNPDVSLIKKIILPKEKMIKTTSQECMSLLEKSQKQLDQIHQYIVETEIQ